MTEQEFWSSSFIKINFMIDKYIEEMETKLGARQEIQKISSMKEIEGW